MKLTFRLFSGKKCQIEANGNDTLESLIPQIAEHLGIQDKLIHITIGCRIVNITKKIKTLPLKKHTILNVVMQSSSESPPQMNSPELNQMPDTPSVSKQTSNKLLSKIPILPSRAPPPKNVDELVSKIVSLGFPEEKAKQALQLSYYNIELAINYLLDFEKVPEIPKIPYDLPRNEFEEFKQKICSNEVKFGGIHSSQYDLNPQEMKEIYDLEKEGFEREFIIQVYFGLERDWTQTKFTLKSIAINSS